MESKNFTHTRNSRDHVSQVSPGSPGSPELPEWPGWNEKYLNKKNMDGLHRDSRMTRMNRVAEFCELDEEDVKVLTGETPFSLDIAENLIENVIGVFPIPLGVATHFVIDGRPVLIPMAVEETSIIAACSSVAKWIAPFGGVRTYSKGRLILGQIQLPLVADPEDVVKQLKLHEIELIKLANSGVPGLVARGGGVEALQFRVLDRATEGAEGLLPGKMIVIHILCDPCDAMGANLINQVCEALKPRIESITGQKVGLCILSNLVDSKLVGAEISIPGIEPELGRGIQEAWLFAQSDPYRATTHNKGVLNGIDPILIATGNDWRAVEAGIHAYAARSGKYLPVTQWKYHESTGVLTGSIEVPMALGTVGGMTRIHPTVRVAMKMLKVQSAIELARLVAAVGLVQNLGALRALASVGIVKGHMQLHAANLAIAAGAQMHEVAQVRERLHGVLLSEKKISLTHAQRILSEVRGQKGTEANQRV